MVDMQTLAASQLLKCLHFPIRALWAWKAFVIHSIAKKQALNKAFRQCFGNVYMRAMQSWKAHVDLRKLLKRGFETYQVGNMFVTASIVAILLLLKYAFHLIKPTRQH